jgi:membrane protease YdiL (CAAX protease family)
MPITVIAGLLVHRQLDAAPAALNVERPSSVLLFALVLIAALINACGEELLWRGLVVDRLASAGLTQAQVLLVASLSFGAAHWHGLPGGWAGVLGATGLGFYLGLVRQKDGLLRAVLLHALVDVAVYGAFARSVLFLPPGAGSS